MPVSMTEIERLFDEKIASLMSVGVSGSVGWGSCLLSKGAY